jgi:hypothetical protein
MQAAEEPANAERDGYGGVRWVLDYLPCRGLEGVGPSFELRCWRRQQRWRLGVWPLRLRARSPAPEFDCSWHFIHQYPSVRARSIPPIPAAWRRLVNRVSNKEANKDGDHSGGVWIVLDEFF